MFWNTVHSFFWKKEKIGRTEIRKNYSKEEKNAAAYRGNCTKIPKEKKNKSIFLSD